MGSVRGVADDRMADRGKLAADLVRDTREDRHFKQRRTATGPAGLVERFREQGPLAFRKGTGRDAAHAAAERGGVRQVSGNAAGLFDRTFDERQVYLSGRVRRELRAESRERGGRTGRKDESGGSGVQPVQKSRHERIVADAFEFGVARQERGGECAAFADGNRMAGLPGRTSRRK